MSRRIAFATLLFVAASPQSVPARSTGFSDQAQPVSSGWEFSVTPYAWLIFVTGEQTVGNTTVDISTDMFEMIDEAKELYGFMGDLELRNGRIGLLADIFWAKARFDTDFIAEETLIPGLNLAILVKGGMSVNMAILEPGVAYEIANRSGSGSLKDPVAYERSTAVDFLAGARYWYIEPEIALNVSATISIPALGLSRTGGGRVAGGKTIDWWDPYVGFRVRHKRGPGKELVLRGDIGGFGVGSDFSWHLKGVYNIDTRLLGYDVTAQVGYRALYADYEQGSGVQTIGMDWLWHGPTLGLMFTW